MSQAVPEPQTAASLSPRGALATLAIGHVMRGRMRAMAAAGAEAPPRLRRTAGWRASIFVRDLLQRQQRMRMGLTRPEQIFAVPGNLTAVHAPQQHWHLAYAPRVMLRLAASDRAVPAMAVPAGSPSMRERTVPHDGPRFISTLIERVLNRSERTDTLKMIEHAAPATLRHDPSAAPADNARIAAISDRDGQVQRVFRTANVGVAAAAMAAAERRIAASQSSAQPTRQAAHKNQPTTSRNPPPINIEHLADRVVNAIDRRLIAHRERYGRA